MKELVVISGKGGTGKTSIVASFAALAKNAVMVDCDVDAADLHLILTPQIKERQDFCGGYRASIDTSKCSLCGLCAVTCRFDAVSERSDRGVVKGFFIDPFACEGCGVCHYYCPDDAIILEQPANGELFISEMRYGPMVHAKLGIGEENSGKLVALVRKNAREIAEARNTNYIIVDGPPGIGCPAISSITGADIVLIVTEPTVSGFSDLKRVIQLTHHFQIKTVACINKWDINSSLTEEIIGFCQKNNVETVGRIRYDKVFTDAQVQAANIFEVALTGIAEDIYSIWKNLSHLI
ncbi:MAG: (4Fe-4S)-binding protein [candidate division Zixibacteria bacterium]|nr:(4Fe-4S)-binding protein [candidate division Zixibacteria bacterium]